MADSFALIEREEFACRCTVGAAVNDYPLDGTCYVGVLKMYGFAGHGRPSAQMAEAGGSP